MDKSILPGWSFKADVAVGEATLKTVAGRLPQLPRFKKSTIPRRILSNRIFQMQKSSPISFMCFVLLPRTLIALDKWRMVFPKTRELCFYKEVCGTLGA